MAVKLACCGFELAGCWQQLESSEGLRGASGLAPNLVPSCNYWQDFSVSFWSSSRNGSWQPPEQMIKESAVEVTLSFVTWP